MKITQALISVSDKAGVIELARALAALDIALLSTGGTAAILRQAGLAVTDVATRTGFAEMLDGRVKTLHPAIHGGILALRGNAEHMAALRQHGIAPIDLVVVNLYPFARTVAKKGCSLSNAIENIDIGGPALIRAAAKNFGDEAGGVGVLTDPDDYAQAASEIAQNNGNLSLATRFALAQKAFVHTARYDGMIANWLTALNEQQQPGDFPRSLHLAYDRVDTLRYGENPHQRAAFYRDPQAASGGLSQYSQLQGKELSYNNLADADAAWECVKSFTAECACVIVKHANPCGVAVAQTTETAYRRAFQCDPTSAFGGIIAFNRTIDAATASAVAGQFAEVIIAPDITPEAREIFAAKVNLRVLIVPLGQATPLDWKRIGGGLLLQTADNAVVSAQDLKTVSQRAPTTQELDDLLFAWRVAKFVKSNAIVYCKDGRTVGVGAGQMSRVDSARIAKIKAENNGLTVAGSVVASDAFFPFRDGLDVLAQAGATAVIQPGGSVRDAEVVAAADEHNIAMVFTGIRHFRH